MGITKFFRRRERLIGVDIGAAGVKIVEVELGGDRPELVNIAAAPLSGDIFANNTVARPERVAPEIARLLSANGIVDRRAVTAVPGPSVFVKKMKMPNLAPAEIGPNVQLEAGNLIPHNLDAVKLDYQVVGRLDKNSIEVLLVAAKNDVIDSFTGCLAQAGLETAIVDVDVFALQNVFELARPELRESTVALINMGARFTSVAICSGGRTLFTGDAAIGGRACTELLAHGLGRSIEEAEAIKCGRSSAAAESESAPIIARWVESAAVEINRQLGFFWSAVGAAGGIDRILISGGGAEAPGFVESLAAKTELPCERLGVFRGVRCRDGVDAAFLAEIEPCMGVALGLALRQPGDKPHAGG